ncbi:hypothetical protein B0T14DRAFT_99500 [Immersiella caudata]|uniref:Uncharacterized protein n=1 Tax=Immersiella caudata TaxID=314043 RepID=A0AA39X2Z5_9PEZI|nr:hypothetical protein B0T14DRAFT_99500 [Immersiella caudata]
MTELAVCRVSLCGFVSTYFSSAFTSSRNWCRFLRNLFPSFVNAAPRMAEAALGGGPCPGPRDMGSSPSTVKPPALATNGTPVHGCTPSSPHRMRCLHPLGGRNPGSPGTSPPTRRNECRLAVSFSLHISHLQDADAISSSRSPTAAT